MLELSIWELLFIKRPSLMSKELKYTFPALFADTVDKYGNCDALAFVGQKPMSFTEVNSEVNLLIEKLESVGVKPGDKVAILSANMPNWGIAYFATVFMGAIVVPLLPDFISTEIENILNHSEAKVLFCSSKLKYKLKGLKTPLIETNFSIEGLKLTESSVATCEVGLAKDWIRDVKEDDLAAIIYTSGTTGSSKGVMLTHKSICFTAMQSTHIHKIGVNDRLLSILPMSHTYENTLGFVMPMFYGSCVYYLGNAPTPSVLLPALKKVKPTMMFSVPLIIEKIYNSKVLATFNKKGLTRFLYKLSPFRKLLNRLAGKKLMDTFGGELKFFGIGGAKLNRRVEQFLIEGKFPYAIGYGLTETAPLLAGSGPAGQKLQSTGPALKGVSLKISDVNPKTGQGEVWAKGPNVMRGYYKDEMNTKEVLTEDGWFKTGDLGSIDENGNLFINGRIKNMIVGASGENIYPEEIESVINNFTHVIESLVVQQKGKLVALVHFNQEELEERYTNMKEDMSGKIDELKKELQTYVNERVNKFSQIHVVLDQVEPFIKTATKKIKRFLYSKG